MNIRLISIIGLAVIASMAPVAQAHPGRYHGRQHFVPVQRWAQAPRQCAAAVVVCGRRGHHVPAVVAPVVMVRGRHHHHAPAPVVAVRARHQHYAPAPVAPVVVVRGGRHHHHHHAPAPAQVPVPRHHHAPAPVAPQPVRHCHMRHVVRPVVQISPVVVRGRHCVAVQPVVVASCRRPHVAIAVAARPVVTQYWGRGRHHAHHGHHGHMHHGRHRR